MTRLSGVLSVRERVVRWKDAYQDIINVIIVVERKPQIIHLQGNMGLGDRVEELEIVQALLWGAGQGEFDMRLSCQVTG